MRLRIAIPALVSILLAAGCDIASPDDGARIRVWNNSEHDLDSVTVNGTTFGRVPRGLVSNFVRVDEAWASAHGKAKLLGRWRRAWLIDRVGEEPRHEGSFTYMLAVAPESDDLYIELVAGDSPQGEPTTRITTSEDRAGYAATPVADGGLVIAGRRRVVQAINPTVATTMGSPVVYRERARVYRGFELATITAVDAQGTLLWERELGVPDVGGKFLPVVLPASAGGFFLGGELEIDRGEDGIASWGIRGWLLRINGSGDPLWSREAPGEVARFRAARSLADGGFVLVGEAAGHPVIARMDADGDETWSRVLTGMNFGEAVAQLPDGGFAVAGNQFGNIYQEDAGWVARTDAAGIQQWVTKFGGSGVATAALANGGILVGGANRAQASTLWFVSPMGTVTSTRTYIGRGVTRIFPVDDGFLLMARDWYDLRLIRIDQAGDTVWTRSLANSNVSSAVAMPDGGFTIVGAFERKLQLRRIDAAGEIVWSRVIGN